ncbi:MAG TPA: cytochrome P450 [Solirubrobacteraceae bacterium]|nr:cytochrome P450 [Solirubrobacteraceae bacterium]
MRDQLPPGPRTPALLNLIGVWKRPTASLERLRARYGKRVTVKLPFQPPFVILSDPDDIRELFQAPPDVVHPGEGARILEPILGSNSVILLDEDVHLRQRKLLLPAFHGERMQRLTGLMTELAERELDTWPAGEPIRLHPRLQRLTLEIILRAVFGLSQGRRLDDLREALTELLEFSESPLSVVPAVQRVVGRFGRWRRFDELMARADELIYAQIEERRADAGAHDDIVAMLLQARDEAGAPMTDVEIRDELMTALVAGHETTASQLAWAFERLAREPRVSERLVAELQAGESEQYLMATIHEVMRLRPVLPNAEPRLTKAPIEIGGFRYPAGVCLLASAYLVQHDPEIYPEPYAFRPERFLEASPGTYTWIPFGGGRRRCLGASFATAEMKIVLRAVLTRHEVLPATPAAEVTGRRSITYSPAGGAAVVLRPRRRQAPAAPPGETVGLAA